MQDERFDLFEQELHKFTKIINDNKKDIMDNINANMEQQNVKVVRAVDQARKLVDKVSANSVQLTEH